jgi:hypothetical protein
MAYQHQSRDRIIGIIKATGKPMSPKEIWDAQKDEPDAMTHAAIRKLLRDMLRGFVVCENGRYSLLATLSEGEKIALATTAFERETRASMANHQRRHTVKAVFISVFEKLLSELKPKPKPEPEPEPKPETEEEGSR